VQQGSEGNDAMDIFRMVGLAVGLALLCAPLWAGPLWQPPNQPLDITSNPTFGNLTATGTIKSTAPNDIGWTSQSATNQACNTTCTTGACVFGFDDQQAGQFRSCSDPSSDRCLCAG
jgi:hypothetical protein